MKKRKEAIDKAMRSDHHGLTKEEVLFLDGHAANWRDVLAGSGRLVFVMCKKFDHHNNIYDEKRAMIRQISEKVDVHVVNLVSYDELEKEGEA